MWWDIVVRVNAAEPGKTPRGALSRYDSVVCCGIDLPIAGCHVVGHSG